MNTLSSPIRYMKLRRARRQQTRTALQMLSLSGVLRPSHVELRYAVSIASISAFRAQSPATQHPKSDMAPQASHAQQATSTVKQPWQWTRNLSSILIHLAHKPIHLHWTKQLDV